MNGWLVHTIRSIVAAKNKRPKLGDSIFPFDKVAKGFFAAPKVQEGKKARPVAAGEIGLKAHFWRQRYEQAMKDYKAGKTTNRAGLRYGESMAVLLKKAE